MLLMNDFHAEPSDLTQDIMVSVQRVIESGWYILGNELKLFEQEWAEHCGTDYCIGVGNGMDAIEIILRSLDIGSGDEVITTPNTAFATVLAIIRAGATPVLADIDEKTGLLRKESAVRCISSKTKAILLVHLYGQVLDVEEWAQICTDHSIYLIEDCAQSHQSIWNGKHAGNFGIAGAYSFYPTKNLGGFGDSGAIITQNSELADKAQKLRNYGQNQRYHHPLIGLNSRLDEVQAAILRVRMKWLSIFTNRRREIANRYLNTINSPYLQLLSEPVQPLSHVYHLFVLRSEFRTLIQGYLQQHEIQSFIHYPIPIHKQESCLQVRTDPNGLPNSESFANTCFSIPCHPQLTDEQVMYISDVLNDFRPN